MTNGELTNNQSIANFMLKYSKSDNAKLNRQVADSVNYRIKMKTIIGTPLFFGFLAVAGAPLGVAAFGAIFTMPILFIWCGLSMWYDAKRLGKWANSNKIKNREYYENRVLYYLTFNDLEHELLKDPTILAYSLWLSHNGWFTQGAAFHDFMKNANIKYYNQSKNRDRFEELAMDIIGREIEKDSIPAMIRSGALGTSKELAVGNEHSAISSITNEFVVKTDDYSTELEILNGIEKAWNDTQMDIVQVLKYPLFTDMRNPLLQSFNTKLNMAKLMSARALDNNFLVAIVDLQTAWDSLVYEAHRIELSNFDDGEQKRITMARDLMDIALSGVSSPFERQSAYKKAMEQLQGLVVIPRRAMDVLESRVNKMELTE